MTQNNKQSILNDPTGNGFHHLKDLHILYKWHKTTYEISDEKQENSAFMAWGLISPLSWVQLPPSPLSV